MLQSLSVLTHVLLLTVIELFSPSSHSFLTLKVLRLHVTEMQNFGPLSSAQAHCGFIIALSVSLSLSVEKPQALFFGTFPSPLVLLCLVRAESRDLLCVSDV